MKRIRFPSIPWTKILAICVIVLTVALFQERDQHSDEVLELHQILAAMESEAECVPVEFSLPIDPEYVQEYVQS